MKNKVEEYALDDNNIMVHIRKLRKKIETAYKILFTY
jgi:DNA-binding response OmpR family regulator